MVIQKHEFKKYIKKERVLVSEKRYCDVCKNEITGPYWSVTTGHYDWGSESCESRVHSDVCSRQCLNTELNKYIGRSDDDCNTEYLEVDHHNDPNVKGEITYEEVSDD